MKSTSKINQIQKYKRKEQSQFRVHFHLMNVYCSDNNNYDKFLGKVTQKVSAYIRASIVQISNVVDDNHVDLSIGAQNDNDALRFLVKKTKIVLPYQNETKQYQPRISTVFQTYIDKNNSIILQRKYVSSSSQSSEIQNESYGHKQESNDIYSEKYRNNKSRQTKKTQVNNKIFYSLWLFGIPLQFDEREVENRLRQYRLFFRASRWKMIEDMEYLQIQLQNPINFQAIDSVDIRVGRYPIVVVPKLRNQEYLYDEIKRFQCQITSKQLIDQPLLMKIAYKFGGILSIIKEVFSSDQMYILVFNNHNKLNKFKKAVQEEIANCTVKTPSKPIRIGRFQRYFSCEHLFAQHYGS